MLSLTLRQLQNSFYKRTSVILVDDGDPSAMCLIHA